MIKIVHDHSATDLLDDESKPIPESTRDRINALPHIAGGEDTCNAIIGLLHELNDRLCNVEVGQPFDGTPRALPRKPSFAESWLKNAIEEAWGIIANAGRGNWELESEAWNAAAKVWRNKYLKPTLSEEELGAMPEGVPLPPAGAMIPPEMPDTPENFVRVDFIVAMNAQIAEHQNTNKGDWNEWKDGPRRDFTDPIYRHADRLAAHMLHKEGFAHDPKRTATEAAEIRRHCIAIANYAMKCAEVFGE